MEAHRFQRLREESMLRGSAFRCMDKSELGEVGATALHTVSAADGIQSSRGAHPFRRADFKTNKGAGRVITLLARVRSKKAVLILLPSGIAISLCLFLGLKVDRGAAPAADSSASSKASANLAEVRTGEIVKSLRVDSEMRAVNSRVIFTSTLGESKIVYLPPEGSLIKAGDRLVEMDTGTVMGKIKEYDEKIIAADNEIVKTRATQEAALKEMEIELSRRWLAYEQARVNCRAPVEVVPRRKYQENQLVFEKAKAEYDSQQTKIEQQKKQNAAEIQVKVIEKNKLKVQYDRAMNELETMTARAPTDGMVVYSDHWFERRKVQIGDVIWGGFPIVRLPDLRTMEVVAQVNEVDGPRLSVGQTAVVTLDSYPGVEITGSVKEISETAAKASWMSKARVFRAVVSLDKTVTEIMKPGMSAQVTIAISRNSNQLLTPRSSVVFEGDSAFVLRQEGENPRRVAVTILSSDHESYAVAENGALKQGDHVVYRPSS